MESKGTNAGNPMGRGVIELLSPARDYECGVAAIDHGADAVYIGAPQFSARKAAGNTIDDISRLVDYAHLFGARVHVALNTLLFDDEVEQAKEIAWQLYRAGVDVLIVQDMALLSADMPPIELHASTQCDNRTAEKVAFWQSVGLRQVVLARELSLKEIEEIARKTTVRLEAFVHGALCVSYSGQCFMSYCEGGRSANRGECAQPCRLPYRLLDNQGNELERERFLLSLKDNNQSGNIERLIDAGVSSFKIEGRLKEAAYVSNVTLYYRRLIDSVLERRPELRRLSLGETKAAFEPNLSKSFNRGFSDYFARGRRKDIWQPGTSKSLGEELGTVVSAGRGWITTDSKEPLHNGDGLCFARPNGDVVGGSAVNGVAGGKINMQSQCAVRVGDKVFRNYDIEFDRTLQRGQTQRQIGVCMTLRRTSDDELELTVDDEEGIASCVRSKVGVSPARNPEAAEEQIKRQLSKAGQTHFEIRDVLIDESATGIFAPASELNALRREALQAHETKRIAEHRPHDVVRSEETGAHYVKNKLMRQDNVLNNEASAFYARHGAEVVEWGYERQRDNAGQLVMTTRHCILFSTGRCLKASPANKSLMPLELVGVHGRYRVETDCEQCVMKIFKK